MSIDRPEWMEGGVKRPKAPPRPFMPEASREYPRDTTHRNVVIGVTLLALVTLFTLFFWVSILIFALVNPPDPFQNDLTWIRFLLALAAAAGLTKGAWMIADEMIDD